MPLGVAGWVAVGTAAAGAAVQSDSARKAANAQKDATNLGIGTQTAQADRAYADQQPYRDAGVNALGQLQADINKPVTAADVMQDPGYQFGLNQGQQALDRKAAAAGGRLSGASLKAAQQYGTDYAASGYGAAYQRNQDRLNRLAALAGIGQTGTQASASSGANAANSISNLYSSQGNAAGAAQLAQGNIWGNTLNQLGAQYGRSNGGSLGSQGSLVNGGGFTNVPAYMIQGEG